METVRPAAVLFDVGMTLVHADGQFLSDELTAEGIEGVSPDTAAAAMLIAFPARHLPLPAGRDYVDKIGLTLAGLLDIPQAEACRALRRVFDRPDLYRLLDPDAISMLSALQSAGVRLGVVSNSDGNVNEELASFGLLDFFGVIVDSTVVEVAKPDPRIFEIALGRMGLPPTECWYVGDNLVNDVLGAKGAQIAETVLYDRFQVFGHIPGTLRIHRLSDLTDLVLQGAQSRRKKDA